MNATLATCRKRHSALHLERLARRDASGADGAWDGTHDLDSK
jgi:hypothetical protein